MNILILSFSGNNVSEDSFVPNKIGLTFSCVDECIRILNSKDILVDHICMNKKDVKKCMACGKRGWGICYKEHKCALNDDFNEIYDNMGNYDAYIFVTPVYFWEMSESAKTFFDRLKRCDAFNKKSKIRGKKFIAIACAGGSGNGTENTLNSFDIFNHFMEMNFIGRIPVTRFNFENQKKEIKRCIDLF